MDCLAVNKLIKTLTIIFTLILTVQLLLAALLNQS